MSEETLHLLIVLSRQARERLARRIEESQNSTFDSDFRRSPE